MFFKLCLQVLVTSYNELDENEFLDPRTAQVAIIDHVKQVGYLKMLKHIFFVCCLFLMCLVVHLLYNNVLNSFRFVQT